MAYLKPQQIAEITADYGKHKVGLSLASSMILGGLAGAFIAIGYLLDIRVTANLPASWGSLGSLIGGAVFPVGLILVLLAGGELLTGNMMAVPLSRFVGKITSLAVLRNLIIITVSNFAGAIAVAYLFGHIVGLTEQGPYLTLVTQLAGHKLEASFLQAFISGIGCNWLVALAVWLSYGADSYSGKMLGIWFPTMAFVAIGFQHVVANMFLIPAAIFAGHFTWMDYLMNFIPVWLGNLVGGSLFVAGAYYVAFLHQGHVQQEKITSSIPLDSH
ncbi:formate/nitrite transporter [Paenibacillus shirakamiensis]|uniref:Formate/nitrite transporter n=1 Tax=Paenibacillus shirakamiensis TaxID=1265935 RepID=A0ABS4JJJ1_9BACL|nr:formate/nitrite transporter family protein [Paenibacillus shirakamiensis]MBP2001867.1 formate/nitrite transporter [Paenibacillus shirakamiensis]